MRTIGIALSLAITLFHSGVLAETLNVAGSTTVQKRLIEPGASGLRTAAGIEVKIQGIGTGQGMLALFDGKVPAAAVSESMPESVASAMKAARDQKRSLNTMMIPLNLQFHELAKDNIIVIVNKDNPIGSLGKDQLKDINTGKVRNWMDVGGPNLPITVVTSHAGSATRAVFQRQIMDNADYTSDAVMVSSTAHELEEVSNAKGGIGAVSEGFFKMAPGRTRVVDAPIISRPLGIVTVGAPKPEVKKLVDYYRSPEGRKWLQ